MFKHFILLSVFALTTTSCVSSKLYKELEGKYNTLKSDYDELSGNNDNEILQKKELEEQLRTLQEDFDYVQTESNQLAQEVEALQKKYNNLDAAYSALEQNSSKSIEENAQKNRELLAQGVGNMISGLIGGLPVTQVIVRSSANIQSGAKSKTSAIVHGFFLLISIMIIPNLLNMIPLSVLAAILFVVGYKLAKPALFVKMYKLGWKQFIPFITTIVGIIFIDLLYGIGLGLFIAVIIILIKNYQNSHIVQHIQTSNKIKIKLAEEVTFINKNAIYNELDAIKENTEVEFDTSKTKYLDHDIIEILDDFVSKSKEKNIDIKVVTSNNETVDPKHFIENMTN